MHEQKPNDNCFCNSGKKFKKCCGQSNRQNQVFHQITKILPIRFFMIDTRNYPLTSEDDEVLVFKSRADAAKFAEDQIPVDITIQILGLGPEKWSLFQSETKYVEVSSEGKELVANTN